MNLRSWCHLAVLGFSSLALNAAEPLLSGPPTAPPDGPPTDLTPEILASRPSTPPPLPDPTELYQQLALLDEFLGLSDEQLKRVRETVGVIERMSPEERGRMRTRLAAMRQDARQLETELTAFTSATPATRRSDLRRLWLSLRPGDRMAWTHRFQQLTPATRSTWVVAQLDAFREREEAVIEGLRQAATKR